MVVLLVVQCDILMVASSLIVALLQELVAGFLTTPKLGNTVVVV